MHAHIHIRTRARAHEALFVAGDGEKQILTPVFFLVIDKTGPFY